MTETITLLRPQHSEVDAVSAGKFEIPTAAQPARIYWGRATVLVSIHLLALAALSPYAFSWTGLMLVLVGHHLFGMLGVTLGYHRLLTHRSLQTPKWLERSLATLGVCCLQDTPARWVAIHRMHHQYSDCRDDPHTPAAGFLWGHFGWLFYQNQGHHTLSKCDRYAHDVLCDPYYFWLERGVNAFLVYATHAVMFFLVGFGIGWNHGGSAAGLQFGLSLFVWGVIVRTVVVWHGTWAVNSITHVFGYRNYRTREDSRNNWIVALLSHGEGWHNNHHAQPRCANNRHKWWEFDLTFQVIRVMQMLGLAANVVVRKATPAEKTATSRLPLPEVEPTARVA